MTVAILLAHLHDKGVTVRADGNVVRLRPRSALTHEDIAAVAAVKHELLQLLVGGVGDPLQTDIVAALTARTTDTPAAVPVPRWEARPSRSCYWCGGKRFWRSRAGVVTCSTCHPPAMRAFAIEEYEVPGPNGLGDSRLSDFACCVWCGGATYLDFAGVRLCPSCASRPGAASVAAYRRALERHWALAASDAPDRHEFARLTNEVARLIDDLGAPMATTLRRRWAAEWWRNRNACPTCGGPEMHDPETGEAMQRHSAKLSPR
ncbi:MAG: hypothetical protein HY216_10765 [Candidatus Rokubacteria bacterium]|nr:hypothetical protein [Candidatus Rokubacteria bacterium]